jgi:hypothetical protein
MIFLDASLRRGQGNYEDYPKIKLHKGSIYILDKKMGLVLFMGWRKNEFKEIGWRVFLSFWDKSSLLVGAEIIILLFKIGNKFYDPKNKQWYKESVLFLDNKLALVLFMGWVKSVFFAPIRI